MTNNPMPKPARLPWRKPELRVVAARFETLGGALQPPNDGSFSPSRAGS